ncbi:ABC transporter ATPase [bacterium]|nr:ABC transporter ATPase [bacterium]
MSVIPFGQLPETSRLWIYGSDRKLTSAESEAASKHMSRFLQEWTAHKRELTVGWQLKYERFFMIAVDESQMAASGCSIDSLVHNLRGLESLLNVEIMNNTGKVFFRDSENQIRCVTRLEFKELVSQASVSANTIVFNNTLQTMRELREEKWEVAMSASWHMEAFGKVPV